MVVKYGIPGSYSKWAVTEIINVRQWNCGNGDSLVFFTPACDKMSHIAIRTSHDDAKAIIDKLYDSGRIDVSEYYTVFVGTDMLFDDVAKSEDKYGAMFKRELIADIAKQLSDDDEFDDEDDAE